MDKHTIGSSSKKLAGSIFGLGKAVTSRGVQGVVLAANTTAEFTTTQVTPRVKAGYDKTAPVVVTNYKKVTCEVIPAVNLKIADGIDKIADKIDPKTTTTKVLVANVDIIQDDNGDITITAAEYDDDIEHEPSCDEINEARRPSAEYDSFDESTLPEE